MNKKFILGAFAVASLSLASCSQDEVLEAGVDTKPVPENPVDNGFKLLGDFQVKSELGNTNDGFAESKSPQDIDNLGRPIGIYPLDKVGLLALTPHYQPNSNDINSVVDMQYGTERRIQFHNTLGGYKVYYKLTDVVDNSSKNASNSGKITLSTKRDGSDAITLDLTVFDLDDLHSEDPAHIQLNKFAYGKGIEGNLRGTTLRYVSFDPQDKDFAYTDVADEASDWLVGRYAQLPELQGYDFLRGSFNKNKRLVEECGDIYFSGTETLLAADSDKVYILESILEENKNGGHYVKRVYPSPEGHSEVSSLNMSRFTSIVNASFMLVDQKKWGPSSYFKEDNEAATLKNFKNKYGVDLSDMVCPYATLDGVNTRFYFNETKRNDKSSDPARLVMWADGLTRYAANGKEVNKVGQRSMDLNFNQDGIVQRGYGIQGNSYSVIFQGSQDDTSAEDINFYVNVDGVNVLLTATINKKNGISFSKNTAHNIMVFVPASDFAKFVKEQKKQQVRGSRSAEDYAVFKVSSDCVKIVK